MKLDTRARIIGMGTYLPKRILSNTDFETIVDTSDEWITTRTGMKERRIAESTETTSYMGAEAAIKALKSAGLNAEEIDLILVVTTTPDFIMPSTASVIQDRIGAKGAAAFDLNAACSGYLYGLSCAKAYIESGMYKNVLIVATEKMSAFVDYEDRTTCILFGDGAAASVISCQGDGYIINHVSLGCDGKGASLLTIPGGGASQPANSESIDRRQHYIKMNGPEIFKRAVRKMCQIGNTCLDKLGLTIDDVAWVVPHQANSRILDVVAKNFGIKSDRVYQNIQKYGNTSASSVPIALSELFDEYNVQNGERLMLLAFGAGLTWGASVLTKEVK